MRAYTMHLLFRIASVGWYRIEIPGLQDQVGSGAGFGGRGMDMEHGTRLSRRMAAMISRTVDNIHVTAAGGCQEWPTSGKHEVSDK